MKPALAVASPIALSLCLVACVGSAPTLVGGEDSGADTSVADGSHPKQGDSGADAKKTSDSGSDALVHPDVFVGHDAGQEQDATPDSGGGTDAANSCTTAPTTDYYVNAATGVDTNSGGGTACAFKTISAALTASAGASGDNSKIHVAAGTYGAGETFPIVVNHGRSLLGAGAGTTSLQGSSAASVGAGDAGSFLQTGAYFVTMEAGDVIGGTTDFGATTISGITLLPAAAVTSPTANYLGLTCVVGNGPNTGTSPPLPPANLILTDLTVGPNFDTGVIIGSEPTLKTACNAVVTGSTFTGDNNGLVNGACGTTNPVSSWPSAAVGTKAAGSNNNTFTDCKIDVFGEGCGSALSVYGNNFSSGYRGIVLISGAQYFEIIDNTFGGSGTTTSTYPMGVGVQTSGSVTLSKLNGNTFSYIAESSGADTATSGTTGFAVVLANVLQAQGNIIHDNDNGVYVEAAPPSTFDFSSDSSASNANQIYCNSKLPSASGVGFDLTLAYAGGSELNFAGNVWDHSTPSTSASLTTSTNGTDVVTGTSGGAVLSGSTTLSTACATARVH
jgi:hypothetical protein